VLRDRIIYKYNMYKIYKKNAFTLIELLVVISIIGLLASVVLASLNVAREKAQWSKFLQDTDQIMTAIEMYVSDHGGDYMSLLRGPEFQEAYPSGPSFYEIPPLDHIIYLALEKQGGYIKYDPKYSSEIFDKKYDISPYDHVLYSSLSIELFDDISYSDNYLGSNCRTATGVNAPYYIFTYNESDFKTSYISNQFVESATNGYFCLIPKVRN